MSRLFVSGSFDDLRLYHVRYLQDMANRGKLHVLLWSDALIQKTEGRKPKSSQAERAYLLKSIRYVEQVRIVNRKDDTAAEPFDSVKRNEPAQPCKRILVTGNFDRLHPELVQFLEEVASLGDIFALIQQTSQTKPIHGMGHPLIAAEDRQFMVGALRPVKQAIISVGEDGIITDQEIAAVKPDIFAVSKDADSAAKRAFYEQRGIEYRAV